MKFRTLGEDHSKPLLERQFTFGRLLRFTNLDEIPQVWHILIGEMSWVGPRPLPEEYTLGMTVHQRRRFEVRPGITGLSQIADRHRLSWEEKFKLDVKYVEQLSLLLDLTILVKTVVVMFTRRHDNSLLEKPFQHDS